jgi:serine/threonine protein kinase
MPVDTATEEAAANGLGVTVVQRLKQGGQKTVLLVEKGTDRFVMKVMSTGPSQPDALKRATREVELLGQIDHPNVVKVASDLLEHGEPPQAVAWLEEYLEGEDLGDAITAPWDWSETKQMATEVARGLAEMHKMKVVHRDLSANNVRKLAAGTFVVMDPGYARHTGRSQLTAAGQPGTLGFLSPEHLQNYSGAPTAASDVFCVGVLMHLALTQDLPIAYTGDLGDYAVRLSAVQVTDIKAARPDLSDDAVAVIRRCLHPQPARRYRNGQQLTEALEAV